MNNIQYLFNNGPFVIEPLYQVVKAHSRARIKVTIKSEEARLYTDDIEVLPTHGEKLKVPVVADVQDVHICLTRYFIDYQQLYSNRVYTMDREPQCIRMRNLGNIASRFKWTVPHNPDVLDAMIDPAEGVIGPKSDVLLRVKFSIKLYGKFTFYFKCDLDNMELPLGFELTGKVVGLDIVYENMPLVDELALSRKKQLKKMQKNLSVTDKSMASSSKMSGDGTSVKSSMAVPETSQPGPPLKSLEFLNLMINEPYTFQFKIRNLSGIQTHFRLNFDKYDASHVVRTTAGQLSLIESGVSAKDWESTSRNNKSYSRGFSINSDSVNKVRALTHTVTHHKKLKLLNDQVEQTHVFYSENGMKATKAKYAQKEAEDYLTIGKGVALVCDPVEGHLAANSEVTVKIKVYNELSGIFKDTLYCSIKGLDPVSFPTTMIIKGCPLKIPTDQVGLNIQSDPPILDFGGKLRDADPLEKTLKLSNIGTQPLEVTLKIFNIDELDRNRDHFSIKILEKSGDNQQPVEVKWDPIEPDQTSSTPFNLDSYTLTIPPKTILPIKVHYDSNEIRAYNSVLTIAPRFKRVQRNTSGPVLGSDINGGGQTAGSLGNTPSSLDASFAEMDLGLLSVLLRSRTLQPSLALHEKPNLNGEISFKFDKWSVGRAPQQTRTILLLNDLPCHLYFQCVIEGAFSFLGNTSGAEDFSQHRIEELIEKNESAIVRARQAGPKATERHHKKYKLLEGLDVVESSNMGVLLNFEGFDPQDYENWPNTRIHFVSGNLQVVFRNGETQQIRLEGWLYRPFLFMNSSGFEPCHDPLDPPTLDFGLLHIDDDKTLPIWLCNKSPVPAQWKIVYVPFPQKDYYGAKTVTALEKENLEKMDDPEVFSFDVSEGQNPGSNIGVNMVPSGNAFWDRKDNHGVFKDLYPKKLKVMFKPKLNLLYKCKYKILVKGGPSIQFFLKGRGSYEEKFKQKP